MKRKEARNQAFILIFEKSFRDEPVPEIIEDAKFARELQDDEFTLSLVEGVLANLEEIDAKIAEKSIGWKMERISKVALAIMRLCCFEMLFVDTIPVSVSINEAVELAKVYGSDDDPAYINGVLGSIARAYKPEDPQLPAE